MLDWDEDEIVAPDVEKRQTLLALAKMTNNAYLEPGEAGWYELDKRWNVVRIHLNVVLDRCSLFTTFYYTSHIPLAGIPRTMDSADMSLRPLTIPPSCLR